MLPVPKKSAGERPTQRAKRLKVSMSGTWPASTVPDGAGDLVADLYQRIPDTRITDILLEVDDATRFTGAFTHLRTGAPCRDRIGLLNVLLAEGINLGLRKMAEATSTHGVLGIDAHRALARRRRSV